MKIIIAIPAYNEEKNIGSIVLKLKEITENVLVCDDGSTDSTTDIAEKMGATVIKHEKNLGYGAAIKTLFSKGRELEADILVTFDADGQHRINDIEKVLEPIISKHADLVIGSRFLDNETKIPKYRKVGVKAITELTNLAGGTKISDSQSGFRAYNKNVLENIKPTDTGMGISTEILIKAQKIGYKIAEVPIKILYKGETSTHNPVSHGSSVVFSTLKYTSIERPLTFYGIPGMSLLCVGLFFGIWSMQIFAEGGKLITNIALVGGIGTILGIILLISAVILHSIISVIRESSQK